MRICMLLQANFPPDIRVEKEADALSKAGHEIHLVCRNKSGLAGEDNFAGIQIHRLQPIGRGQRLNKLLSVPLFLNPVWYHRVNQIVKRGQIQIIHVHDLPLMPLGLFVARKYGLPVVYDMHENYPEAMRVWRKGRLSALTVRNPLLAEKIDRFCQNQASEIIVVVEEQKENLVSQGIPAEKIHVISNTAEVEKLETLPLDQEILNQFTHDYVIIYVGGFSRDRGLEVPIQAMKILKDQISRVKLVLVGSGDFNYMTELKNMVSQRSLETVVEFINWVPFEKVPSFMKAAKIGIVPQPNNPFINTTIPHKLFQYMAMELPVVVSDAKPLARIVREGNCGQIFKSGSPDDFARAVLEIYDSESNMGKNGAALVRKKYNWQTTGVQLQRLYAGLSKNPKLRIKNP